MKSNDDAESVVLIHNKITSIFIVAAIIVLIAVGIILIVTSIWCDGVTQNILVGLGTGFITSALITILFEIKSLNERKNNSYKIYNTLLQELREFISLFVCYLNLFIDQNDDKKCFVDFLQSKRNQINKLLKINTEQNEETNDFKLLYDHINISTCQRIEIKKNIDRAYELSTIYFSVNIINDMQYRIVSTLHEDFYQIIDGVNSQSKIAITAFCYLLNDIEKLLTEFKDLSFYNNLVFEGGETKAITIKDEENLTKQQIRFLNFAIRTE